MMKLVAACLLVLSFGALGYRLLALRQPLVPHRGDGTFREFSPVRGYSIRLPEFDLGEPYQAKFRLAGLPDIGKKCGIYLAIEDPGDRWLRSEGQKRLSGSLRLELLDSGGTTMAQASGNLRDYIWGHWRDAHKMDAHRLYQMGACYFVPVEAEEYLLRIGYSPDPALASLKGFAYLECGGSK
jgi:hypothetical protein